MQSRLDNEPITIKMQDIVNGRVDPKMVSERTIVQTMYDYFRENGFPFYQKQSPQIVLRELTNFKVDRLVEGDIINQSMDGLGCINYYFPHMWYVRCNDHLSPMDVFNNDEKLKIVLNKVWKWCIKHENHKVSFNRIRQGLKIYGGAYAVSNFRPTVAKYIYEKYGGKKVWDMCAGWGGRLLGALSSKNVKYYYGTEPSTKTYLGLIDIKKDFNFVDKKVIIECSTSEDYIPDYNLDLCFTSPPYFNTEKYSDEPTQSYIKYPTYDIWKNDFLYMLIDNCYMALKEDGILIINIANTPKQKTIETDVKNIFKNVGFKLIKTYKMVLSSVAGKGIKYEPIFVCEKS